MWPGQGLWDSFKKWLKKDADKNSAIMYSALSGGVPVKSNADALLAGLIFSNNIENLQQNLIQKTTITNNPVSVSPPKTNRLEIAKEKAAKAAAGSKGDKTFIVNSNGTVFSSSANQNRESLNKAGIPSILSKNGDGTIHTVNGIDKRPFFIRIMDGNNSGKQYSGPRIVTTQDLEGKQYVQSNGLPITGAVSKDERKAIGHTHLDQ
jgi:hypothetical protein